MTRPLPKGCKKTDNARMRRRTPLAGALILALSVLYAQSPYGGDEESPRLRLIRAARAYLGVPYVRGGTTVAGMDCSGLVYRSALDSLDIALPRTVSALSRRSQRIDDKAREPGDLLFFNTTGSLSHVGIFLGNGSFIHAASDGPETGVIISSLSEAYWSRTYRHAGRILNQEGIQIPEPDQETAPSVNPFPFMGACAIRLNLTLGPIWDFMPNHIPLRGGTAHAEASLMILDDFYPGVGAGITYDDRTESWSVPVFFSFMTSRGFRFFIGTQLHLVADDELDRSYRFPGILGFSWTSRPMSVLGQNLRFYQSVEYSNFGDETIGRGLRFHTGLTISFDL